MNLQVIDIVANIGILSTGLVAVYLTASQKPRVRMIAGWFGLAGEPFWFTTALINEQWGVLILAFVYAGMWWRVIQTNKAVIVKRFRDES